MYPDESKTMIKGGVDILMKTAVDLLGAKMKMKKGEPLPIEKEDQAASDGGDKAADMKLVVPQGGVNQTGDEGVHRQVQDR
jgi:hypothetical protein